MSARSPSLPIYVISDLHLDRSSSRCTELLDALLDEAVANARSLVILGDLFDAWIGDDALDRVAIDVATKIQRLKTAGLQVFFVPGNRDFLVGHRFCAQAGMVRVEEPIIVSQLSGRVGLIHGDILCTDDHKYQSFRAKVRDPRWADRVLRYPVLVRRALARFARWRSRRHGASMIRSSSGIADVNSDSVASFCQSHKLVGLIHGHTHRIGIHALEQEGVTRYVLCDWDEGKGSVVVITEQSVSLNRITLNEQKRIHWSAMPPPPVH